jgi:integrase
MASISRDKGGTRRILFVAPDGSRKAIRLGKVSQRAAEGIKYRVEQLLESLQFNRSMESDLAQWVKDLEPWLAKKLARVGLILKPEVSQAVTLEAFCRSYIDGRANLKPNTKRNYETTKKLLVEYFGADRPLAKVSPGDADDWRETLLKRLSVATVSREVKRARQFFRAAIRKRFIAENPFTDLASPAQVNSSRVHFVTADDVAKVIEACPDTQWRLIVALSRYGGLRCPSEHLALKWDDIDWALGRMIIRSPKTEHHTDGGRRVVPIFPELRPYLDAAWDEAPPKSEFVITRYRDANANLRTQFLRIIERAGLKPWPRLFHNLRASRQTELTTRFPLHVGCDWIGNSAPIADKHYLQVTEAHYTDGMQTATCQLGGAESGALGAQNAAQQARAAICVEKHETKQTPTRKGIVFHAAVWGDTAQMDTLPPRGVEPLLPD